MSTETSTKVAFPRPQFRTVAGVRIRYADSGGTKQPTLLLTCPWPESVYAFEPIWGTLAEHARLFAIDLPGFGASQRSDELLSPMAMGEFLAELIVQADLGRPYIVASGRRDLGRAVRGRGRTPSGSAASSSGPAVRRSRSSWAIR